VRLAWARYDAGLGRIVELKEGELNQTSALITADGSSLPLNVTVRAIADPVTSEEARTPEMPFDADPQATVTQIGERLTL
jgi:hypothetical protein